MATFDSDGEIFTQLDDSITSGAMSVNISQLADLQQIIDFSSKTKELMVSKLDFRIVVALGKRYQKIFPSFLKLICISFMSNRYS